MMARRLLVTSILLSLSVPWATEAQGTDALRSRLGRLNQIRTATSAYMDFRLDNPITWSSSDGDIEIAGGGRYFAFMIARLTNDSVPDVVYKLSHFGACTKRGCKPTQDAVADTDGLGSLEPGSYRLYVVADGEPVEILWKVEGLDGSRVLRLTDPVRAKVLDAKPMFHNDQDRYFSSGVTYDPPGRSITYDSALWVRTSALGAEHSLCSYEEPQPEERAQAFTPQYCALHDNQANEPSVLAPSGSHSIRYYVLNTYWNAWGRLFSTGHWFVSNAPIERAGSTHVFITM